MDVETLLKEEGIEFKPSGNDYLIRCLNPDHEDTNPSFRIDKISGIAHCFSCGFKTNIFNYYNKVPNLLNNNIQNIKNKIKRLVYNRYGITIPSSAVYMEESYRGLSADIIKEHKFFTVPKDGFPDMQLHDYILVPMFDSDERVAAIIGRHKEKEGVPKYKIYPIKARVPLYPYHYKVINNSIIVVEGLFDALHLRQHGLLNAVSGSGTESFLIKLKENEASFRIQGLAKIYLMMDGDTAGQKAAEKMQKFISEKAGFMCETIELEDGMDPSDLSVEQIREIEKHVNGTR